MGGRHIWIGSSKSFRVILENSLKIYECPESAARDIGASAMEVRACCERRIRNVSIGLTVQWLDQYAVEHPDFVVVERPIQYYDMPLPKRSPGVTRAGGYRSKFLARILPVIAALNEFVAKEHSEKIVVSCTMFHEFYVDWLARFYPKLDKKNIPTAGSLVKMMRHKEDLLKDLFGISFSMEWSPRAHRKTTVISITKMDPVDPRKVRKSVDLLSALARNYEEGSNNHPVIQLDTKELFLSVHDATVSCGANEQIVRWCCIGDVDTTRVDGSGVSFRYIRFVIP